MAAIKVELTALDSNFDPEAAVMRLFCCSILRVSKSYSVGVQTAIADLGQGTAGFKSTLLMVFGKNKMFK